MRLRTSLAVPSLLLALFAACGGDEGGQSGDDGGGDDGGGDDGPPQDSYVPPQANCTPLDLAAAPMIPIQNTDIVPNGQAGTVVASIYTLSSIKLDVPVTVEGTAQARVEIDVGNATSGAARIAVTIDATALGEDIDESITGAGLYTLAGPMLTVADGCGSGDMLPVLDYTATGNTLTMWTEYMITDPIPLNIPIELGFTME
jgi:hypothetical protein